MESIYHITSRWWARIIIFFILNMIFYTGMIYLIPSDEAYIHLFISLLLSSILIESFRRNGKWYLFGIRFDFKALNDFGIGILLTAAMLGAIFLISYIMGANVIIKDFPYLEAFRYFTLMVFIFAAIEELFIRGVIFQALLTRFNEVVIVLILSLLFSLMHYFNPEFSVMAMINIFLANILMSLLYLRTLSLWMPISFHFFWNWGQQMFLGSPVSGYDFGLNYIRLDLGAIPESLSWLTGGYFGIEEGFLTTVLLITAIALVPKYTKISAYMSASIFKRDYAEAELINGNEPSIMKNA